MECMYKIKQMGLLTPTHHKLGKYLHSILLFEFDHFKYMFPGELLSVTEAFPLYPLTKPG